MKKTTLVRIGASLMATLPLLSTTAIVSAADDTPASSTNADGAPTSSDATFKVDNSNLSASDNSGKLILEKVPTFDFGSISSSEIYNGFKDKSALVSNDLGIADTRLGSNNWSLGVSLNKFSKGGDAKTTLTGAELSLAANSNGWPVAISSTVNDDNQPVVLAQSDGTKHGDFSYAFTGSPNTLTLGANNMAILNQDDQYQATLTWTLASSGPVTPAL